MSDQYKRLSDGYAMLKVERDNLLSQLQRAVAGLRSTRPWIAAMHETLSGIARITPSEDDAKTCWSELARLDALLADLEGKHA